MGPCHSARARTYKLTVEDCVAFDTAMLRKLDMLLDWMDHRLPLRWQLGGILVADIFVTATFTGDIAYPSLRIDGTCFGRPIVQTVRLVSKEMRFGGRRWYFVCPKTKRHCCKLVLPPGATAFASVKGWNVAYRSQRDDAVTRTRKTQSKLLHRLRTLPSRTRHHTLQQLSELIEAKEVFLGRVMEFCELEIASGGRMSVKRAVKSARTYA